MQALRHHAPNKLALRGSHFKVKRSLWNVLKNLKKSYALSFILQDTSKTLTDVQIDKIMSKLQGNFEAQLEAVLR